MKRLLSILLIFIPICIHAEQVSAKQQQRDTVYATRIDMDIDPDSVPLTAKQINRLYWKPDPIRAVWLGALVPGLGQIYNRSYWKLPIVYGGVMGCVYGITYTQDLYVSYSDAYRDLYYDIQHGTVTETTDKSYIAVLPNGYTISRLGGTDRYLSRLQEWQSSYRRYRDISIMAAVVVYALSLIDAYVDAQLFDFDISDDLSMQVTPQIYYDMQHRQNAELHLAITF